MFCGFGKTCVLKYGRFWAVVAEEHRNWKSGEINGAGLVVNERVVHDEIQKKSLFMDVTLKCRFWGGGGK